MLFRLELRTTEGWQSPQESDDRESARTVEDWKSNFTDLKPTRYGFDLTREFLMGMDLSEIARFTEAKQEMRVTRVA